MFVWQGKLIWSVLPVQEVYGYHRPPIFSGWLMRGIQHATTIQNEQQTILRGRPENTKHQIFFHPLGRSSACKAFLREGHAMKLSQFMDEDRFTKKEFLWISYSHCQTRSLKTLVQTIGFPDKFLCRNITNCPFSSVLWCTQLHAACTWGQISASSIFTLK